MEIKGAVIAGNQYGRRLGFPTANVKISEKIEPGIYAGFTIIGEKRYLSALYIGNSRPDILESHIIDFSEDLYGKEIKIEIKEKISEDIQSPNMAEKDMQQKIQKDVESIKQKYSNV